MSGDAWLTLAVLTGAVALLVWGRVSPALVLSGATVSLLATGVIDTAQALSGFSNPAPFTVAGLYVIAAAVQKTGALTPLLHRTLGQRGRYRLPLVRVLPPSAAASAFVNNTPVVAMLIPLVDSWARRRGLSSSKLLMPMSFAALLGGMTTLVGASTNLVVAGQMAEAGLGRMGFFEIGAVGLPIAVVGVAVVAVLAPRVLPDRRPVAATPAVRTRPAGNAWLPVTVLASVVVLAATGLVDILVAVLAGALLLVAVGVLSATEARRAVNLEVILVIASAFGIGAAVESSGLAALVADGLVGVFDALGPRGVLLGIVVATIVLTEVVTNNAAALLMFPVAMATATTGGLDPRGTVIAIAVAASASFLTPIGYQTNTMIHRPGGYRFGDYARLGLPLTVLVIVGLVTLVPVVWPA